MAYGSGAGGSKSRDVQNLAYGGSRSSDLQNLAYGSGIDVSRKEFWKHAHFKQPLLMHLLQEEGGREHF